MFVDVSDDCHIAPRHKVTQGVLADLSRDKSAVLSIGRPSDDPLSIFELLVGYNIPAINLYSILVFSSGVLTDRLRVYLPSMSIGTHNIVHPESIDIVVSILPLII
jgi:hypothetical protein